MLSHQPRAPAPADNLLDDRQLEALEAVGGIERTRPLIRLFIETTESRWSELTTLGPDGDLRTLEAASHDIAGAAGNFGARQVAIQARRLMAACDEQDRPAVRDILGLLGPTLQQTLEQLRRRYGFKS